MEYNYSTRNTLKQKYLNEWEKTNSLKTLALSDELKAVMKEMECLNGYYLQETKVIDKIKNDNPRVDSLSLFMKEHYKVLVDLYVPEKYQEDYYYILDKYNQFQYAEGYDRRSVRTANYSLYMKRAFRLMYSYMAFGIYRCEINDYLKDNLAPEQLDYKRNNEYFGLHLLCFDDMLAARLDAGDRQIIETVREAFLSENNTAIITTDMIRAVIKSSDTELHEILCRFLLAARLQEGVRQAVCENADCGTTQAFIAILDTIADNNLLRFAAVKRAVATWTGICSTEHMDRISDKVFRDIREAVKNLNKAYEFISTNDSIHIMIGLWALGFYEADDAVSEMKNITESGTRNQILTVSYYNRSLQDRTLTRKTAAKIFEKFPEDYEMIAAFMPTYMPKTEWYVSKSSDMKKDSQQYTYFSVPVSYLFDSREQARQHYQILKHLYENLPKKKLEFNPCIFPWYGVSLSKHDLITRMALISYSLQDNEMEDYLCGRLTDVETGRWHYIRMLLHDPQTKAQKEALISYVADKETYSRETAYELVSDMTLSDEDYMKLEGFLRYKNEEIRCNVIKLIKRREPNGFTGSIERLLASDKEAVRLGGLDLVKNNKDKLEHAEDVLTTIVNMQDATEKEQILIDEITGNSRTEEILKDKGYGIYNPDAEVVPLCTKPDISIVSGYFDITKSKLDMLFNRLCGFLDEHAQEEYVSANGSEVLLGNGLTPVSPVRFGNVPFHEIYPLPELWREFYETNIKDNKTLMNMYVAYINGYNKNGIKNYDEYIKYEKIIFGNCSSDYSIPNKKYRYINVILKILISMFHAEIPYEVAEHAILYAAEELPENVLWNPIQIEKTGFYFRNNGEAAFAKTDKFKELIRSAAKWSSDEEFQKSFWLRYSLDEKFKFNDKRGKGNVWYDLQNDNCLELYDYIKAYDLGMISEDIVYKAAFEDFGVSLAVERLGIFMKDKLIKRDMYKVKDYIRGESFDTESFDTESSFYKDGCKFYKRIVDTILDVELKRGDTPTVFSESVKNITRIYGIDRLMAILAALGKDTLDRKSYYYFSSAGTSKKVCFSHLLQVCYPSDGDTALLLGEYMKNSKLKEDRLIETAMYAPQWLDIVEEYLGYDGFKSGCYYFMAHMNESFDDKKKAMIAKYTPLTPEELNQGCFDVKWFFEAYDRLGETVFNKLYDSAKYISDGSKHSRARKYADAALGRVTVEELEEKINAKRNKDLLMSYGIVPVKDKADILHRYEYLQQFLKESRQFGAQRKASEGAAVKTAMKNLATAAGYTDETRLILAMETELVKSNEKYFDWCEIQDCRVRIEVSSLGKAEIRIEKNGKKLKSVPAALKKEEAFLNLKEFAGKLKDQYSRTVKMLENSMEEREYYTYGELRNLCENPVTKAIVENLVFIRDDSEHVQERTGFVCQEGLQLWNGDVQAVTDDTNLRVAHPYDLYAAKSWSKFQQIFFDRLKEDNIRQPFKQVFRELYVKLPEELDKDKSLMFAGNQIQPQKTAACLKGRRWIADYEEGLQKIYYKDNIIAVIYALADWFSPSDIEAPDLEYVIFYDRKNFKRLKISDVPDVVYSEVMRDVDLAVSVAHAGGVDPETSHSTIEMRKVIMEFNRKLFKLDNVAFEKNHAIIEGKYGKYSIHMGSGVIHQLGGHQINVLPVHAQSRGKLFLPFIDDDPKTSEIMSKILLFAQDGKIKDPYILNQLSD